MLKEGNCRKSLVPGVPEKFPDLRCYFSTSACYLINIIKEICYTKPNLGFSFFFISTSVRIDALR